MSRNGCRWTSASRSPIDEIRLVPARPTDFPDTPGFGFPVRFRVEVSDDADFAQGREHRGPDDGATSPIPATAPVAFKPAGVTARYVRVTAKRLWKRTGDYVFALAELEVDSGGKNVARGAAVDVARLDRGRPLEPALSSSTASTAGPPCRTSATRRRRNSSAAPRRAAGADSEGRERPQSRRPTPCSTPATRDGLARTRGRPRRGGPRPPGAGEEQRGLRRVAASRRGRSTCCTAATWSRSRSRSRPAPWPASRDSTRTSSVCKDERRGRPPRRAGRLDRRRPSNPLTWRSIVNRVWHYHFGRGIVDTPSDFGRNGSRPTHPELLDWLAVEFRDGGGSFKKLHRLIVTSAAYRQASRRRRRGREDRRRQPLPVAA